MIKPSKTMLGRILDHVFPRAPDFFGMLREQTLKVAQTVDQLVEYMKSNAPVVAASLKQDVHQADLIKARNMHALNDAFTTPIDREDIHRAIISLDDIVMYCRTTINEMDILGVTPDDFTRQISLLLKEGVDALANGFAKLGTRPIDASADADTARKIKYHAEKLYHIALPQLFQGDDYINMFKRREIYRHLLNASEHMALCANTLQDIVVKIT
jgi:uncharacterized protein Yka (UPF0111/DUF47 family)